MKPQHPTQGSSGDPNQGEGDKSSARHYNNGAREFVAGGKVDDAARDAKGWVERDPAGAARAEAQAKHGPGQMGGLSVAGLVSKGRSVIDRLRPMVDEAAAKVRSRIQRNK